MVSFIVHNYLQVRTGKVYDLSAYFIDWIAMSLPLFGSQHTKKRLMKQQNQEANTAHFTQMKAQSIRKAALLRIVGSKISILEVCALHVLVQLKRNSKHLH